MEKIAVTADIKRMFYQVFVAPEDRGALCFLRWPNGDIAKDPNTHQMLVHIFGAKSSPSVAGYAPRKVVQDNKEDFSREVVDDVYRDFYVDDLLKSFPDSYCSVNVPCRGESTSDQEFGSKVRKFTYG